MKVYGRDLGTLVRPFRGVHNKYVAQYGTIFENNCHFKGNFKNVIRAMFIPDSYLEKNNTS